MKLQDFESHVPKAENRTGREYFSREKVLDLMETGPGKWTAGIFGRTKLMDISVTLKGDKIVSASCPCETFKPGTFCKHVIAMLYAMRHAKGMMSDFEAFAGCDPGSVAPSTPTADREEMGAYANEIRKSFSALRDVSGHIYRQQSGALVKVPNRLIKMAKAAYEQNDFRKATNIVIATLYAIRVNMEKVEHGFSLTNDETYECFELLGQIVEATRDNKKLQERIYEHAIDGARDLSYDVEFYQSEWLTLLIEKDLIGDERKDKDMMDAINLVIERARKLKMPNAVKQMAGFKYQYYRNRFRIKAMQWVLDTYPELKGQAPIDYDSRQTKELPADIDALEKIMMEAERKNDRKNYLYYRYNLIRLLVTQNNKEGIRRIVGPLYKRSQQPAWLTMIRDTYSSGEWESVKAKYD
jgi:hypothetical protein